LGNSRISTKESWLKKKGGKKGLSYTCSASPNILTNDKLVHLPLERNESGRKREAKRLHIWKTPSPYVE
jgi:hypothetical protein